MPASEHPLKMQMFKLPYSSDAPGTARRIVEEQLAPLFPQERADELIQVVSELAANAVRLSPPLEDGTIGLLLERYDDKVYVAVIDGGTHLVPDELTFERRSDERFGLFVVDAFADGWGFSLDGVKGVWVEMELRDG